jgi:hypothetical protein
MTHEEHRELEILSAAEAYPKVKTRYSIKRTLSWRRQRGVWEWFRYPT